MSLPHALLTALLEKSSSGIELSSRFDRSIGYFWHATHQQIYRELARLEEAGWIESLPPESGRGRKRVYRVLPAGRAELRRWAGSTDEPAPLRNALMVKLRAEAALGGTGVAQEVERLLAMHEARLAVYLDVEKRHFGGPGEPSRSTAIQHLVLKAGILGERMWIDWAREALAVLALPDGGRPAAGAAGPPPQGFPASREDMDAV